MTTFERHIELFPAYDKRDPDPSKDYGIHGVELKFLLKAPEEHNAVSFIVYTNWFLPETQTSYDSPSRGAAVGYHSSDRRFDFWDSRPCEYTGLGWCYPDVSYLDSDNVFEALLREGSAGVWKALESRYAEYFALDTVSDER